MSVMDWLEIVAIVVVCGYVLWAIGWAVYELVLSTKRPRR